VCTLQVASLPDQWVSFNRLDAIFGQPRLVTYHGIEVSFMAVGKLGTPDVFACWTYCMNTLVFMTVLNRVFRVFVLGCLGKLSSIYKAALDEHVGVDKLLKSLSTRLVCDCFSFESVAPQGKLKLSQMLHWVVRALDEQPLLDNVEKRNFAMFCFKALSADLDAKLDTANPDGGSSISKSGFLESSTASSIMCMEKFVHLIDASRSVGFVERLFLPTLVRRLMLHTPEEIQMIESMHRSNTTGLLVDGFEQSSTENRQMPCAGQDQEKKCSLASQSSAESLRTEFATAMQKIVERIDRLEKWMLESTKDATALKEQSELAPVLQEGSCVEQSSSGAAKSPHCPQVSMDTNSTAIDMERQAKKFASEAQLAAQTDEIRVLQSRLDEEVKLSNLSRKEIEERVSFLDMQVQDLDMVSRLTLAAMSPQAQRSESHSTTRSPLQVLKGLGTSAKPKVKNDNGRVPQVPTPADGDVDEWFRMTASQTSLSAEASLGSGQPQENRHLDKTCVREPDSFSFGGAST